MLGCLEMDFDLIYNFLSLDVPEYPLPPTNDEHGYIYKAYVKQDEQ